MIQNKILSRYTCLPIVIDMLTNRRITLISPSKWKDRNDVFAIDLYRKQSNVANLLALCFTKSEETFHHWYVFADGISGARIEFDTEKIIAALSRCGLTIETVEYKTINALRSNPVSLENLPFIKRAPYRDEDEMRVILTCNDSEKETHFVPITLDCIKRVTLSPWIPKDLTKSVRSSLHKIKGCSRLKIFRSTLLENDQWKSALQLT